MNYTDKTPIYLINNKANILKEKDVDIKIKKPYYEKYTNFPVILDILKDCKNKKINRKIVLSYFKERRLLHGFFSAMIWGGVSTGGISGDNLSKILNEGNEKITEIIKSVELLISENQFKYAYLYMKKEGKINGLGDSFYTKLFFFIGEASKQKIVPPIYDKWTKLAHYVFLIQTNNIDLAKKFGSSVKIQFANKDKVTIKNVEVNFNGKYLPEAYNDYVEKMNLWSEELETSVNSIEQFIFGIDKRTIEGKKHSNPRLVFECFLFEYYSEVNTSRVCSNMI